DWPFETVKILFCSLLSPLDLFFTWDRICRSILGVPATQTSRRELEEGIIRPLNDLLIKKLGFTPIIAGPESIRIDQKRIHIDAHEFYKAVIEGLKELSLTDSSTAVERFRRAGTLYTGSYLPDIQSKIITNTRTELETLYRTIVMDGIRQTAIHP